MKFNEKVQQTKDYLLSQMGQSPSIGLVLGSGLGILADEIENPTYIPYNELPHFPASTVTGHAGRMVIGDLKGKRVIAMQGRFHYYEGHSLEAVTYPIRIMKAIGVQQIIVTNAAGGINPNFKPGDLMIIQDHINLTSQNPLIGPNEEEFGERFPDMSEAYSKKLIALAKDVASKNKINMVEGIYAGMLGPSYETPAEVNFLSIIGASAVGMSTVPEVIVAQHSGLEVLGISCISNMAAGISEHSLTHDEVMETTENIKSQFLQLVKEVIAAM
ncbi:purine-nucleoside phosphorylase [Priestia aryabhattai]|uniref:purine-nucleoside phosphorylase n=1 Tax=Priestia aryabhattai TaxID=412384 RepID=UPI00190C94AE|nr:purine-nucleoside phosphorylase [Priestia aryabhattai]MBK0009964.1 purine-nucleoside phosphorylase [Bacillus sp. S35]MCM3644560.1 purine-nucleoside phosphorylase [Priestia aryabhattai]